MINHNGNGSIVFRPLTLAGILGLAISRGSDNLSLVYPSHRHLRVRWIMSVIQVARASPRAGLWRTCPPLRFC